MTRKTKNILIIVGGLAIVGFIKQALPGDSTTTKTETSQPLSDSAIRKQTINKAFSSWDGSQTKLVEYVKSGMNNPKSFEHVTTQLYDFGHDTLLVRMTFRGTNQFNAVVTQTVQANTLIDGTLLNVNMQ